MKYLSPLFFFVIFVGIVIFFIIESAFNRGVYINNKFPELNEAIVNIQYKTTLAHLSLEELLSGDSTENFIKLKGYIRAGKHYLDILINADSFKYENKELESILDALEVNMNEFEKLTLERYHNKEIAKIGTDFDYKYDIVFKKVLANCSRIEYYTNSMNEQALNEYNVQRYILFGIFFFLMLLSLLYIYSNTRKSIKETKHILSVQKKLEQSLNLFDTNVIASKTNLQGVITDVSQAFLDISGYTKTEMLGSCHNIVRHEDMKAEVFSDIWQTIQSGKTWEGEIKNKHKDGSFYWVYSYINPIKNDKDKVIGYQSVRQDITNKKYVEYLSITDGLTGLYNRRHFDRTLSQEINHSRRNQNRLIFTMVDVDNFKKYNDNYGHKKGDAVLLSVAKSLKNSFKRAHDMVFRLGGEEFGIIFSLNAGDDPVDLVDKARQNIENLRIEHIANKNNIVTASFGVVEIHSDYTKSLEEEVELIYIQADEALYKAKDSGRNKVCLYSV